MKTTLQARLDKTGTRVLCGRPNCGSEIARIVTTPAAVFSDMDRGTPLSRGPATRYVQFGPGWHQGEQGLWALGKGARKRLERDRLLALGNSYTRPERASEARQRLTTGKALANRRPVRNQVTGGLNQAHNGIELPALARCHDCRGINTLETTALDAVSSPGLKTS